jgi:hypothetical protein
MKIIVMNVFQWTFQFFIKLNNNARLINAIPIVFHLRPTITNNHFEIGRETKKTV